jgi:ribosomal protein L9
MNVNEMIFKFNLKKVAKDGVVGIRVQGKPTAKQLLELKAAKPEILAELDRRELKKETKKQAELQEKADAKQRLLSGEDKIELAYHDGEYLSGYYPTGEAGSLLKELGLAKYVDGWGTHVNKEVVDALGKEFTYQQAVEFARPALEKVEAKKQEKEAARQAKFTEAKETGKPVVLRHYMDECNDPHEECDLDSITIYAMPDGSEKTTRSHTW